MASLMAQHKQCQFTGIQFFHYPHYLFTLGSFGKPEMISFSKKKKIIPKPLSAFLLINNFVLSISSSFYPLPQRAPTIDQWDPPQILSFDVFKSNESGLISGLQTSLLQTGLLTLRSILLILKDNATCCNLLNFDKKNGMTSLLGWKFQPAYAIQKVFIQRCKYVNRHLKKY